MLIPIHIYQRRLGCIKFTLTFTNRVRHSYDTVHGWFAVQTADEVGQIVKNRQVVLDRNNIVVIGQQAADNLGSDQPLPDIQIG